VANLGFTMSEAGDPTVTFEKPPTHTNGDEMFNLVQPEISVYSNGQVQNLGYQIPIEIETKEIPSPQVPGVV
jgi:hypothetical protein